MVTQGALKIPNLKQNSQKESQMLIHAHAGLRQCWHMVSDNIDA